MYGSHFHLYTSIDSFQTGMQFPIGSNSKAIFESLIVAPQLAPGCYCLPPICMKIYAAHAYLAGLVCQSLVALYHLATNGRVHITGSLHIDILNSIVGYIPFIFVNHRCEE